MSRTAALTIAAVLVLAGCTAPTADAEPEPTTEETPEVTEIGELTDGPVQDTWVYEQIETVTDGGLHDITDDVLAGLETEDSGVELPGGVTFFPLTTAAHIATGTGDTREDLDVVAGIARAEETEALQIIATPLEDRSVDADDVVVLDLSFLGLPAGSPLVVSYAFGQGLPAEGEDLQAGSIDLLAERMAGERFQWYAVEGEDGETHPGIQTVLGDLPAGEGAASTDDADARIDDAMFWESGAEVVSVSNGIGGGVPAKARPTTDPLGKLMFCTKGPLKCLSDYFKNAEKGAKKSADSLFNKNMPSDPPRNPPNCFNCGGGSGEPHMTTFDQHTYDLQLVGEFVFAESEDFTVHMRTAPASASANVSMITAISGEVGGEQFSLEAGREDLLWWNGEPSPQRPIDLEFEGGSAYEHGGVLEISGPEGARLIITRLGGRNFDVMLDSGSVSDWVGLLGSSDGDAENDLTSRDGEVVELDADTDELYDVFGESWRVSAGESLFDYGAGEDTATFTDLSFPDTHVTIDDLDPAEVTIAEALCEFAGITDPQLLEWCIFDYAATGDISFITSAMFSSVNFFESGSEWATHLPGVSNTLTDPVLDGDGHVLVLSNSDSGSGSERQVHALDLASGDSQWRSTFGRDLCVAVTDSGEIHAKSTYPELGDTVEILDPADGSVLEQAEVALEGCSSAVAVGDDVLFHSGEEVLGFSGGESTFEASFEGLRGSPVISEDGRAWVAAAVDEAGIAHELDPGSGESEARDLPVLPLGNIVGTADGFAAGYKDDDGGLLLFSSGGGAQLAPLPYTFEGEEYTREPSYQLRFDGQSVATYLSNDAVGVIDTGNGDLLQAIHPSSFPNNGSRLAFHDGLVSVGPFGGTHWVERYDAGTGELAETFDPDDDFRESTGMHDAKVLGPHTADGQVVVQSSGGEGIVVALVGAGG